MVRLIDAHALLSKINQSDWHNDRDRKEIAKRLVINAPTIEERKTGKWIEYDNSHCECPFCHKEWSYFENLVEYFNYCPYCGAKMGDVEYALYLAKK